MKRKGQRALVEMAFIVFLFYANLLMGEFTRSGEERHHAFLWAVHDVFTAENFVIAVVAALIGYALVEFLRERM